MSEANYSTPPLRVARGDSGSAAQLSAGLPETPRQTVGSSGHYLMLLRQRYSVRRELRSRQLAPMGDPRRR